jgi:hypothetical protein
MSELPPPFSPPFSPRKRRIFVIVGVLMIVGTAVPLVWWLSAGVFETPIDAWPVMAAFAGVPLGAFLLFAAAHGRRVDPWGSPEASWRRASLYKSLSCFIALIVLIVLIPLRWMYEPRLPTPWWWWLMWAVAVMWLPFQFKRLRELWQECRADDRQAGR